MWATLEARWRVYGNTFEEAEAALAFGRAADDAAATARGRAQLDDLGVPPATTS
jgi:hypothetical protein